MTDLKRKSFGPDDIVALTGGRVTLVALRQWVQAGWFTTKIEEPRASYRREFPLMAVYEAVLLSVFARLGVPYIEVREWNRELLKRIRNGNPPKWFAWTPGREKFAHHAFNTDLGLEDLCLHFELEVGDPWGERKPAEYRPPAAIAILNFAALIKTIKDELEKRDADDDA